MPLTENPLKKSQSINRNGFDFHRVLKIISFFIPIAVIGNVVYAVIGSESGILEKFSHYKIEYLLLAVGLVLVPVVCQMLRILLWSRKFEVKIKPIEAF